MGFLRLLTNRHVMQEEVVSPDQAWETYQALRSDRRIRYLAEPGELTELWPSFTLGGRYRRIFGLTRTCAPSFTRRV